MPRNITNFSNFWKRKVLLFLFTQLRRLGPSPLMRKVDLKRVEKALDWGRIVLECGKVAVPFGPVGFSFFGCFTWPIRGMRLFKTWGYFWLGVQWTLFFIAKLSSSTITDSYAYLPQICNFNVRRLLITYWKWSYGCICHMPKMYSLNKVDNEFDILRSYQHITCDL